jgi:hypothetical protein
MRFTLSNTPGCTSAELAMLNKARSIVIDAGLLASVPENQINGLIASSWKEGDLREGRDLANRVLYNVERRH